ncbi:MAG: hypothetical protein JOZ97_00685 [Candidatus Eremiobacteraeota bacterium]|nr:hypothetical protein [Candidatus Eremiobacteraeota bacterium]
MKVKLALVLSTLTAVVPLVAAADDADHDITVSGGAWRGLSVPCTKGTVSEVAPRLTSGTGNHWTKADFASGVGISFKVPRGYKFINTPHNISVGVVHYQNEADNAFMMTEKAGDPVQVCLMSYPTPQYDAKSRRWICNPDTDARGYIFRVYDYKRHRAYYGPNSEHGCGGA